MIAKRTPEAYFGNIGRDGLFLGWARLSYLNVHQPFSLSE
jgi:hypothetical protein